MVVTSWAMTAATFQLFAVVVLATDIIDAFGLSRFQLGLLGALNTGVGAILAPRLGGIADRIGSNRSMILLLVASATGLLLTAVGISYWVLLVASALSGLPQGACNSVTNKVIADDVPASQQGTVTGVKQSGVQFAVFLSGATLPGLTVVFGWQWAVALSGLVTLTTAGLLVLRLRVQPLGDSSGAVGPKPEATLDATGRASEATGDDPERLRYVRQVAAYALLLGLAAGGVSRFYPLFATEVLEYSPAIAGLSVALAGAAAIAARVLWAAWAGRLGHRTSLVVMGVGGSVAISVLLVAEPLRWLLFPTVVGLAFTTSAWNVVAMLAVITTMPATRSGWATGVVQGGFLGGLTISAPLVGWSVDQLDSYRPAWIALALLALAGATVIGRSRSPHSVRASAA